MLPIRNSIVLVAFLATLASPSLATQNCDSQALANQRKDIATIQRLENAWTIAYIKGDTDFERCLLSPDYTEITRNGEVKVLADELSFAEKNKGKNLAIPKTPSGTVLIHGNVATAYGMSTSIGPDGKPQKTRYADYYVWESGVWHAFFAQQTPVQSD